MVSLSLYKPDFNTKPNSGVNFGYYNIGESEVYQKEGDRFQDIRQYDRAVSAYKKSLEQYPQNFEAMYKLGKTYELMGNYTESIHVLKKLNFNDPNNFDAICLYAEVLKKNGQYALAQGVLEKALEINYNNDFIKRNIEEVKNYTLASTNLSQGLEEKKKQAQKTLIEAIKLAKQTVTKEDMKKLSDVTIQFNETAQLAGVKNLAQYEHATRTITLSTDFVYSDPALVASYVVHEIIHAKDNDPYTSIREEQDAYRAQAAFWVKQSGKTKDPEMDYVADLYKKSKADLDTRVAEIYKQRDPDIALTSPNHPPSDRNVAANTKLSNVTSLPIKTYDVIS